MGFQCCGISIESKQDFDQHQAAVHFPTSTFRNEHFQCPLCSTKINLLKNYKAHLTKFHLDESFGIAARVPSVLPVSTAPPAQHPRPANPFEVRPNINPIEVVYQNVTESNLYEAGDFEPAVEPIDPGDDPMGSGESNDEEIPYFKKEGGSEQLDTTSEHQILVAFAKLLVSLKYSLNVAYKHLIQIVVAVLAFLFILLSNKILTVNLLAQMKGIAESKHYQNKYSDSLKLNKPLDKNFYYTELREVIERYLSDPVICQQLFHEKKRKQ